MRKYVTLTMALGAMLAVSVAGFAYAAQKNKPVKVRAGNLELTFDGGFTPSKLSKTKFTPIKFFASGKIRTVDGTRPPALKEVVVYTDKNGTIDVKGYPTCTSGKLQARPTKTAVQVCKPSIIGKGETTVSVEFPEMAPIPAKSPLTVFNGGTKGGVTTLYIHAYLTQPITTAIVTTVKISKVKKGRYGMKSVASVPLIANGAGSVTDFALTIDKKFKRGGKTVSVLNARCTDGKLQAHATAFFRDNSQVQAEVIRTCTGTK